jgi:large subunit ribosomal protein L29
MKQSVIKEMSTNEIIEKLNEEKNLYVKMKMNHGVSPIENPLKIRLTRRTIARLNTELHARNNQQ